MDKNYFLYSTAGQLLALVGGVASVGVAIYITKDLSTLWALLIVAYFVFRVTTPRNKSWRNDDPILPVRQGLAVFVGNLSIITGLVVTANQEVVWGMLGVAAIEAFLD